jgi:two-component system chemotaxis response regulator CheB
MVIKVLVAEDSAYQRKIISEMVSEHSEIEVVGMARDGEEAIEMVQEYNPDVLLLDVIMPKMDGLTAFKKIKEFNQIPTIIFSVLDPITMDASIQALLLGAFDYVIKPGGIWKVELPKFKDQLIEKVLLAQKSNKSKRLKIAPSKTKPPKIHKEEPPSFISKQPININKLEFRYPPKGPSLDPVDIDYNLIVIGTSVGGPKTLKTILRKIPANFPSPILVVQHLDRFFMEQLAQSLNDLCKINVKIAEKGEEIYPNWVYLAPGSRHMQVIVEKNKPKIHTFKGEAINYCIPSVDVLFFSAAHVFRDHTMGIILTGLGNDGAVGLGAIKNQGGKTIAESKETSVVYGMPKIAAQQNAAQLILPNYEIKKQIIKFANKFNIKPIKEKMLGRI